MDILEGDCAAGDYALGGAARATECSRAERFFSMLEGPRG